MRLRLFVLAVLSVSSVVFAGNAERGQREAEEEILPKLNLLCGGTFTTRYDLASLREHNKDIRYDQTSGSLECDEPLRLIWVLCQTDAGKAAVRKAELREVQCRGTPDAQGKVSVNKGVIVVERAFEDRKSAARTKAELEKALGVTVKLDAADPYSDEAWRKFRRAPAPVTSTTDYCLVNGEKVKLDLSAPNQVRGDGTVKCWKGGALVIDLVLKAGRRTGLTRMERDDWYRVERLVDDRRDGLAEEFRNGVRVAQSSWKADQQVWGKEFTSSGTIKEYSRQFEKGLASLRLTEQGQVTSLTCLPEVRDDEVLAGWCGFKGEKTVQVYDGTGKVSAVRTFRDGRLVREAPGDSRYAARIAVSYVEGKKDGEERAFREDGTLERTTSWKAGAQDGVEQLYGKDGKKVVQRTTWKAGARVEETEFFLNGNPKRSELYDGETALVRTTWFDLGQKESETRLVRCKSRRWCEDGRSQRWHENGKLAEDTTWAQGEREGASKHWYPNGQPRDEESWARGNLTRRRAWDESGALTADDEFEEDGSRKPKGR